MKLSERMKQSRTEADADAPTFGTVTTRATTAAEAKGSAADDPVTQLKRRAQEALILRMGPALWDTSTPASQLDSQVVRELGAVLKEEKIPLNDAERDQLVERDHRLGPRLRADRAVPRRPDRQRGDGQRPRRRLRRARRQARGDRRAVLLRAARAAGDRPHRRAARPSHRRGVTDGRRPAPRRFPGQRGDPAARDRRAAADHPQVHATRAHARRPRAPRHAHRPGGRIPHRVRPGSHEHPHQRRHRQRQDDAAQRAVVDDPRRPSASSRSRTPPSCACSSATSSGSRAARRTSRARARSAPASSCATRCACGPTASWSARSAAPRRSTCSRR